MSLLWHLGFPKTGTTSVQALNRENRKVLNGHIGVFQKRTRTRRLAAATMAWLDAPGPDTRAACQHELRRILRKGRGWGYDRLLISDETLAGWHAFDDNGHLIERLERLIGLIAEVMHDCDNSFVFYTREADAWLRSVHNQEVKHSCETRDLKTWRANVPFSTDWQAHQARFQAAAGKNEVIFRDMLADVREGQPLGTYILRRAGVAPGIVDALKAPQRQNESLPVGAITFMRGINALTLPDPYHRVVKRQVITQPHLFARDGEP